MPRYALRMHCEEHCTALYYTKQHYIVDYCTVVYCTVQWVLYSTVLFDKTKQMRVYRHRVSSRYQ